MLCIIENECHDNIMSQVMETTNTISITRYTGHASHIECQKQFLSDKGHMITVQ